MTNWFFYPKSKRANQVALAVVGAFESVASEIDSSKHKLSSNGVLSKLAPELLRIGFRVESGKAKEENISVPVLFGLNGRLEKCFEADAHHLSGAFVLEVEAGRGVVNNQFLKDLFQACMMHDVSYLAIAVRNSYRGANDFEKVCRFMDTLFASNRIQLPLEGVLIIGY